MGNTDKFEMIAGRYDTPGRIHLAEVSAEAIRGYLVDAGAGDKRAIDFGCGTGLVGLRLLNEFQSVLFLDTSPNMIHQVQRKIADANIPNADTLCFDLERENLPDVRADYIFMAQVLLHIQDTEFVLSRLFGMLNEGGRLLIVDFDTNDKVASDIVHHGFDQAELAGLMTRIGYRNAQSKTFYEGNNLFMGQDASMFILHAQK